MINSLLIANRGEIAVRIIRTCRDLGIRSVAVYSTADREALHVRLSDAAVCIGGPQAEESYLNANNIISAACLMRCDAIHPGVGFLAEQSSFAQAVRAAGLIFIGPHPETLALLGDKISSKERAQQLGLPLIAGSVGEVGSVEKAQEIANEMGYPIVLKASAGGGGKGMAVVNNNSELANAFARAKREALASFGHGALLLERFLPQARHLEVQLLADAYGTVIDLGLRDCSVQKNYQKLIEESPPPLLDSELQHDISTAAVHLLTSLEYQGAGTVEFLVQGNEFFFMEVNARLQVEHPVTELLSGVDLVEQQLAIAAGKPLAISPSARNFIGHAMEARLNALGCGSVKHLILPNGPRVRVDTYLEPNTIVTPYYDALLAKIIVHTPSRRESLKVMRRALSELAIEGIKTNKSELLAILDSKPFISGQFSTSLYEQVEVKIKGIHHDKKDAHL